MSGRNEIFITRHTAWFSTRVTVGVHPTTAALTGVTGPALGEVLVPARLFGAACPGVGAIPLAVASLGAGQQCPPSLSTVLLVCTGSSGMGLLGVAVPIVTLDGGKG